MEDFKTAEEMRKITEESIVHKSVDELYPEYIEKIKEGIEAISKRGEFETICSVKEKCKDELCKKIKTFLESKGYKVKIKKYKDENFIDTSWLDEKNKAEIIEEVEEYDECMLKIKKELVPASFNAFFGSLEVTREDDVLKIIAPNDFVKEILKARYIGMIQEAYDVENVEIRLEDE